jgi:hypothetical protein
LEDLEVCESASSLLKDQVDLDLGELVDQQPVDRFLFFRLVILLCRTEGALPRETEHLNDQIPYGTIKYM